MIVLLIQSIGLPVSVDQPNPAAAATTTVLWPICLSSDTGSVSRTVLTVRAEWSLGSTILAPSDNVSQSVYPFTSNPLLACLVPGNLCVDEVGR